MPHLLHLDSSIKGDASVSRALTARAVRTWQAANPGGTVTYRDLAAEPLPALDGNALAARFLPQAELSADQAAVRALSQELVDEVRAADVVVLGLPLYNFSAPSTVKSWIDHLIFPGISQEATGEGNLGGREFHVLASRGGGYGEGTPRHGWDHATPWLAHALSQVGIEPQVIAVELTLADTVPAMAELKPLAAESLAQGERDIDGLFATPVAA